MKPLTFLLAAAGVVGLGLILFVVLWPTAWHREGRAIGNDIQRGARDAYDATKDAATDARDAVR